MKQDTIIAPCEGHALKLPAGKSLKIEDLEGRQVADLLAFDFNYPRESLSTGATIDMNGSLRLQRGDYIYSSLYNPMLCLVEDTVGMHDLLHPPCSRAMFRRQYGIVQDHPSCFDNFKRALKEFGLDELYIATPFNIFMHTVIESDGSFEVREPLSKPGDFVVLQAEKDLIVAVTACSVAESACNAYRCTAIKVSVG